MKEPRIFHVLFLCTHNSARSVIAETLINHFGAGRFKGYSAGSAPSGRVNPIAIEMLCDANHDVSQLRSKSWDEFAVDGAPLLDFVFTVCDNAAHEVCPVWPGQPITAHWGVPDPSAVEGTKQEKRRAFEDTYRSLGDRIRAFVELPFEELDRMALQKRVDKIG